MEEISGLSEDEKTMEAETMPPRASRTPRLDLRVPLKNPNRIHRVLKVWGLGFGVWGLGFGVWGLGFGIQGLGFRV